MASEQDENADNALQSVPAGPVMVPYMNTANNPNMQHQNSQLWDAFRAGAMWAQSQGGQVPAGYGYGAMPNPSVGSPMAFVSQPSAGGVQLGGYAGNNASQPPGSASQQPLNRRNKPNDSFGAQENGGEESDGISPNQGEGV